MTYEYVCKCGCGLTEPTQADADNRFGRGNWDPRPVITAAGGGVAAPTGAFVGNMGQVYRASMGNVIYQYQPDPIAIAEAHPPAGFNNDPELWSEFKPFPRGQALKNYTQYNNPGPGRGLYLRERLGMVYWLPPSDHGWPGAAPAARRCECGVATLGYGLHSDWCPEYES